MATETESLESHHAAKVFTPSKSPVKPKLNSISKVRVIVRVRPFLQLEIASRGDSATSCISVLEQEISPVTVLLKDHETIRNESYKLDSFFGEEDNNLSQIFYREVSPMIPEIFLGCNATVFAYGATGSGKTYTMQGTEEITGLIPLSMSTILSMCQSTGSTAEISYYEIYLDRCYDLLGIKDKEITILEDKDGQIHIKGLSRSSVKSMSEFHEIFSSGNQRRKVAHTCLNDVSSRSHAVLVIYICNANTCVDDSHNVVTGKLNLIDLAGNEDNRKIFNEGIRLQESSKINQSLFALSNVIYALNNNKSRVPYRDSKLTRILQDSLGGNSHALMVACLNPGNYQESVHTVSLAARSRHISNTISSAQRNETPEVKVDMETKLHAWLESKGKAKNARPFESPSCNKTPKAMNSMKLPIANRSSTKQTASNKSCFSIHDTKKRFQHVPNRKLFNNEVSSGIDCTIEHLQHVEEDIHEIRKPAEHASGSVNNTEKMIITNLGDESSSICENIQGLQSSLRKVLTPINSNINAEQIPRGDRVCVVLFDPKTPKTSHSVVHWADESSEIVGTPLDKFNSQSSNLKTSLIQEYVNFLNKASREELIELKGIGQKMADYILEIREESPLKSLNDLEKIGLSSKQVQNMFNRTAKGIFN
ncbi:kinesin-like protein KIN-10B [Impatiens glandulifera]|uniref:kinesin-like protein KIN-10B n=1 Tax=Impatiens glandulifera TaxID=253017 RepID=UPI001FB084AA|nr:kinesin-like protein KIN-10B [Impatiens glandulifera]